MFASATALPDSTVVFSPVVEAVPEAFAVKELPGVVEAVELACSIGVDVACTTSPASTVVEAELVASPEEEAARSRELVSSACTSSAPLAVVDAAGDPFIAEAAFEESGSVSESAVMVSEGLLLVSSSTASCSCAVVCVSG